MRPVVILSLVLLIATAASAADRPPEKAEEVYPMPEFAVRALDGTLVDSEELRGHVVLLDIWATWCAPCLASAPELDRISRDFYDRGLRMVGIAVDSGSAEEVAAVARKIGMTYPVALWNAHLAERIKGLQAVPTYVLIAPDWTVDTLFVGATPTSVLRKSVEKLLAGGDAGASSR